MSIKTKIIKLILKNRANRMILKEKLYKNLISFFVEILNERKMKRYNLAFVYKYTILYSYISILRNIFILYVVVWFLLIYKIFFIIFNQLNNIYIYNNIYLVIWWFMKIILCVILLLIIIKLLFMFINGLIFLRELYKDLMLIIRKNFK